MAIFSRFCITGSVEPYFIIEKLIKGPQLASVTKALKKISKEAAFDILNNHLLDYITDKQYQRIKSKLGLEELIVCDEEEYIEKEYEQRQDRIYDENGTELF